MSLTFLLDVAKSRSAFLRPGLAIIGALTAATAAVRFIMVVLEELPRRFRDPDLRKSLGTEAVSGFWNRSVFAWLFPVLRHGFCSRLRVEDLPSLGPSLSSERLCAKFEKVWSKCDKNYKFCLMKATLCTLLGQFLLIFIPVLCNTSLMVAQPFFIRRVMIYVREEDSAGDTKGGLVGATIFIYAGIMVSWLAHSQIATMLIGNCKDHKSVELSSAKSVHYDGQGFSCVADIQEESAAGPIQG